MIVEKGLSGQEIYDILTKHCGSKVKMSFTDVYSVDQIDLDEILRRVVKQKYLPTACVINTASSNQIRGEHWVSMVFTPKSRHKSSKPHCYYFDSYGFGPIQDGTYNLVNLVCLQSRPALDIFEFSTSELQLLGDQNSKACGYFAIFAIWALCNGWTLENIIKTFTESGENKDKLAKTLVNAIVLNNM